MHSFELQSNESACRNSGRLGLEQVIGYMIHPNVHMNKAFREQVKVCLKNTFGTSNTAHIGNMVLKENTRVLALVMFYENRKKYKENVQSVDFCNIYHYR